MSIDYENTLAAFAADDITTLVVTDKMDDWNSFELPELMQDELDLGDIDFT